MVGSERFEKGSKIDIKAGRDFERSRKVLASRRKQLTLMGKGNKPNATRPLEPHEVDKLYDYDFFGCSSSKDSLVEVNYKFWISCPRRIQKIAIW